MPDKQKLRSKISKENLKIKGDISKKKKVTYQNLIRNKQKFQN